MTYIPGGGGGSSNISTATDVALNNPTDGQVLTFDSSTGKWINATASAGDISSHTANTDPHAAANYAIMADGGRRIFTRITDPADDVTSNVQDGDIWLAP